MKTLEDVLKELDAAEKEFKEKCLKYGIEEKTRKKKEVVENIEENKTEDNSQIAEEKIANEEAEINSNQEEH